MGDPWFRVNLGMVLYQRNARTSAACCLRNCTTLERAVLDILFDLNNTIWCLSHWSYWTGTLDNTQGKHWAFNVVFCLPIACMTFSLCSEYGVQGDSWVHVSFWDSNKKLDILFLTFFLIWTVLLVMLNIQVCIPWSYGNPGVH